MERIGKKSEVVNNRYVVPNRRVYIIVILYNIIQHVLEKSGGV